ncbi:MAG TPA: DUF4124 domain-containing protein [Candidatus Competibacteraceae bacterium]|nr:DUF4124 domain-containing protein [Candidatus Competibacteraceae bacterium]
MRRALLLALPLLQAWPAWGQVYRWQDADGRVHYGDRPPTTAAQPLELEALGNGALIDGGLRPGERRWLEQIQRAEREYLRERDRAETRRARTEQQAEQERERQCRRYSELLEQVRTRLRRGYRPQEDARLHDQESRYAAERSRWCQPS